MAYEKLVEKLKEIEPETGSGQGKGKYVSLECSTTVVQPLQGVWANGKFTAGVHRLLDNVVLYLINDCLLGFRRS